MGTANSENAPTIREPRRTGRNPIRSPTTPPSGAITAPTSAAVPATNPIDDARPGPVPTIDSTINAW